MSEAVAFSENGQSVAVAEDSSGETTALLIKAVGTAEQPLSASQIINLLPSAVRPKVDVAEELLKQQVADGTIYQYPPSRGKLHFWGESPEEYARRQLLLKAARGVQLKSKIVGDVRSLSACKDISKNRFEAIFDSLVSDGSIRKLDPFIGGKTPLFSTTPADPVDYLSDALAKLSKKLNLTPREIVSAYLAANSEIETVTTTTSPPSVVETVDAIDDRIIEAMKELDPHVNSGAMVSIPELRRKLEISFEGTAFDQALLEESRKGHVALHRFDRENLIDESEAREMLHDDQGVCYNTVSLRM